MPLDLQQAATQLQQRQWQWQLQQLRLQLRRHHFAQHFASSRYFYRTTQYSLMPKSAQRMNFILFALHFYDCYANAAQPWAS